MYQMSFPATKESSTANLVKVFTGQWWMFNCGELRCWGATLLLGLVTLDE